MHCFELGFVVQDIALVFSQIVLRHGGGEARPGNSTTRPTENKKKKEKEKREKERSAPPPKGN